MKHLGMTLLAALALACGGGGGGGGNGGGGTPPDPREEQARMVLEDCGHPTVVAFLDLLESFREILDPAAASPPILRFLQVNGTTATWALDLDGNGLDDLTGSITFLNQNGAPFAPFDLSLLLPGSSRLAQFFTSVPDATRLVIPFVSAGVGNRNGQWTATIQNSVVRKLSGQETETGADCSGTFSFSDTLFVQLQGLFPVLDLGIAVSSSSGLLNGTMTLDGSNSALAAVHLNAGPDEFRFFLNLASGTATPAP